MRIRVYTYVCRICVETSTVTLSFVSFRRIGKGIKVKERDAMVFLRSPRTQSRHEIDDPRRERYNFS